MARTTWTRDICLFVCLLLINEYCLIEKGAGYPAPSGQHHTTKSKQTNKQTSLVRVVRDKTDIDPAPFPMAQDVTWSHKVLVPFCTILLLFEWRRIYFSFVTDDTH